MNYYLLAGASIMFAGLAVIIALGVLFIMEMLKWKVYTDDKKYVAARKNGEKFECMSLDGSTCLWRTTVGQVNDDIKKPPKDVKPLVTETKKKEYVEKEKK